MNIRSLIGENTRGLFVYSKEIEGFLNIFSGTEPRMCLEELEENQRIINKVYRLIPLVNDWGDK
ncbi:hypothetical protein [Bacillus mycoides]|uniref:hypothetical protein n=1 Tax=Bacillus mycoides TaxID=1405 RepID=UPI002E1E68B6|nr:hypothetical protein [Bacillus mycoides]